MMKNWGKNWLQRTDVQEPAWLTKWRKLQDDYERAIE